MKTWRSIFSVIFLATTWTWSLAFAQQNLPPEVIVYPDLIFHNGKVLTADDSFTIAQAVAIRDGKFLAVGDNTRILRMAGPNTQKIDLQGKTVTPGLIDTHFHLHNYAFIPFTNGGVEITPALYIEDLEGDDSREGILRALRKKAQQTPRQEGWIILSDSIGEAHGIVENKVVPTLTQQDMDEAFPPGVPAAMGASHLNNYSAYVVNSAGMKLALEKIPPNTPGIVKSPTTGEPTGQLTGEAASLFGRGILPWPDMKLVMGSLEKVIPLYRAQGLTMIQTKTPGYVMQALREFWRRGQMPIRWRASVEVGPDTEVAFKYLGNLTDLGDSLFRITSGPGGVPSPFFDATYQKSNPLPGRISQQSGGRGGEGSTRLDRTAEARQAALEAMKTGGCRTEACLAAKYGWSMTNVHNNGDMSTDVYMSEIEKGLKERVIEAYGQRFGTDHSLMIAPETPQGNQFERMKKLGIIPSMNSPYLMEPKPTGYDRRKDAPATQVELLSMTWGRERVMKMLPVKSLIAAGFKPTSESDRWYYPASYPFWVLEKLITRKDDKFDVVWGPEERVSRQQALWMKTNWGARYTGDEKDLGSIEPGKFADLVVLDKDYMTVSEDDISKIQVDMTVLGGKIVYDASKGRLPLPGADLPGGATTGL